MSTDCTEGGSNHLWCHPGFDTDKSRYRICLYCKLRQTKVWRNDLNGEEAEDDK